MIFRIHQLMLISETYVVPADYFAKKNGPLIQHYLLQNESSHGDDNDSPRERNFNNRGGYNRGRGRSYSRANQQHQDDRRDLRRPAVAASQRTMSRGRGRGDHYEQRGANRVYNKNASYRGMSRGLFKSLQSFQE